MPSAPVYCYLCGRRINGADLRHQLPGGLVLSVCRPPERDCNARLAEVVRAAAEGVRAEPKRPKVESPVEVVVAWDGLQGALNL